MRKLQGFGRAACSVLETVGSSQLHKGPTAGQISAKSNKFVVPLKTRQHKPDVILQVKEQNY